ncbi:MAG: hypothetical protein EZS28_008770 [Streblomastix strix]|uniref:SPRY domain-containing protein n=1 Tax=Streblomastix strix TaxID=222440 RepID=A0A5J4WLL3_9EUKA|nr:MAG: hypothetical protein EZS28_008770 [Streblomastix strix]
MSQLDKSSIRLSSGQTKPVEEHDKEDILKLVSRLRIDKMGQFEEILRDIFEILSRNKECLENVIKSDLLNSLAKILTKETNEKLRDLCLLILPSVCLNDMDEDSVIQADLIVTPLIVMAQSFNAEISEKAVESICKLVKKSDKVRICMVRSAFVERVQCILEEGQEEDSDESNSTIPIHAQVGLLEVVRILLENGQDDQRTSNGESKGKEEYKIKEDQKEEKKDDKKLTTRSFGRGLQPKRAGFGQMYSSFIGKGANQVALKARVILGLANQMNWKGEEKRFKEQFKRKVDDSEAAIQKQRGEIDFKFAPSTVLAGINTNGKKVTASKDQYKTVCIDPPVVASGSGPIVRCEITFDSVSSGYCGFGLIMSDFVVPDGQSSYTSQPYYTYTLMFHQNGNTYRCNSGLGGNGTFSSGNNLAIEVDMSKQPHVAYFFINNAEQPHYFAGFPDSVKFFVSFYSTNEAFTLTSLKYIPRLSVSNFTNKTARYW